MIGESARDTSSDRDAAGTAGALVHEPARTQLDDAGSCVWVVLSEVELTEFVRTKAS